jgi:hypothetical protein
MEESWKKEGTWYPPAGDGWGGEERGGGVVEKLASRNERSEWRLARGQLKIMDTYPIPAVIDFRQTIKPGKELCVQQHIT